MKQWIFFINIYRINRSVISADLGDPAFIRSPAFSIEKIRYSSIQLQLLNRLTLNHLYLELMFYYHCYGIHLFHFRFPMLSRVGLL